MIAPHLSRENYPIIQEAMVHIRPERSSGVASLASIKNYDGPQMYRLGRDFSLSRQLGDIHSLSSGPPEVYLLTANSAVPVADAIRGYYKELDEPLPEVGFIRADQSLARQYASRYGFSWRARRPIVKSFTGEVGRIRSMVAGARVCVIDQLAGTGNTLGYAAALLEAAELKSGIVIRGDWYEDTVPDEIDLSGVTSTHAPFMHSVGSLAAQQLLETS